MTLTLQVFEFSNLSSLFALLIWPFQDPTLQKHIQRNGPIRTLKVFFKKKHYHPNGFYWGHQYLWTLIPAACRSPVGSNQAQDKA